MLTVAVFLPIVGAVLLWRRDRTITLGLLCSVLSIVTYNLCYPILDIV